MDKYTQVSCLFYDQLTDRIVLKKAVKLDYLSLENELKSKEIMLKDITSNKEKQEFLVLEGGEKVRLDRIQKVDGIIPPHITGEDSSCTI